jgi:lipopolysaccharide assembly protein A
MRALRWILGLVLFAALLVLALQNSEDTTLNVFHLVTLRAPLIFVVLIAFACGVAVGLLTSAFKIVRLKRQLARARRDQRAPLHAPGPHGAAPGTSPASGPGFEPPPDVM